MKKTLVSLALAALCSVAGAGQATGTIDNTYSHANGAVLVTLTAAPTGAPSCALANRFAIDTNTAGGRAMFQSVITAAAMGKSVTLNGTGACSVWGDAETVSWVYVVN